MIEFLVIAVVVSVVYAVLLEVKPVDENTKNHEDGSFVHGNDNTEM